MAGPLYLSLADNMEQLWPDSIFERPPVNALAGIWFEPFKLETSAGFSLVTGVLLEQPCELTIPLLDFIKVVLGADGRETTVVFQLDVDTSIRGQLKNVPITLRINSSILKPAKRLIDTSGNVV